MTRARPRGKNRAHPLSKEHNMATGGAGKAITSIVGLVVVLGVLNLLSWLFDWGWWFY